MKVNQQYFFYSIIPIGFLTLLIFKALWLGVGAVGNALAESALADWVEEQKAGDLERAARYLDAALRYSPSNPSVTNNLGLIHELQRSDFELALGYYRESALQQPADALVWSSIVHVKARLTQFDADFDSAFETAVALGHWEPKIQRLLVEDGLSNWSHLGPSQRSMIMKYLVDVIKNGTRSQIANILEIVNSYKFADVVCPQIPRIEKYSRYCKF